MYSAPMARWELNEGQWAVSGLSLMLAGNTLRRWGLTMKGTKGAPAKLSGQTCYSFLQKYTENRVWMGPRASRTEQGADHNTIWW